MPALAPTYSNPWALAVGGGGLWRADETFPYLTLVLPSQVRLLEFIFPVLSCSVGSFVLRATLLRYATPGLTGVVPRKEIPAHWATIPN